MRTYAEYVDTMLDNVGDQIIEVSNINTVDELHEAQKDDALTKLLDSHDQLTERKKVIDECQRAKAAFKKAEQEAEKSDKAKKVIEDRYNQFLQDQEELDKEFSIVPPSVIRSGSGVVSINSKNWTPEDVAEFKKLRTALVKASIDAKKKQEAVDKAQDALLEKHEPYQQVKAEVLANFNNDQDLINACIPCQLKKRNEKIAKIKQVFPKQQQYGNCGIQSSSQVIELITGDKKGEAELLKDALLNNEAELTRVKENKVITFFKKVFDLHKTDQELIQEITDVPSEDVKDEIDVNATGGTWPHSRESLLDRHNVASKQVVYSRDKLANALKNNKAVVAAVDASLLSPGFTADGKIVETWPLDQPPGGHAVVIADGKFDKNGNLTQVLVSDTGVGEQYYMDIDDFEVAVEGRKDINGGVDVPFNITNAAIK